MIATCGKCGGLCEASAAQLCRRCQSFDELLAVAEKLIRWKQSIDVTSAGPAADQLSALVETAHGAVERARHVP